MEKKKYIQKEDVSDIMEHLTERVLKNADKVTLELNVRRFCGDTTLDVLIRSKESYKTLAKETYIIIDKLNYDYDVSEDVFDAGLAAWEKEQAEQEAVEQTEEITNN